MHPKMPTSPPCLWRQPFPEEITQNLNNSALELAGAISGHSTLLLHTPPQPYRAVLQGLDNTSALSWITHGTTPQALPPAQLLRALAWECRHYNSHLTPCFLPGSTNTFADLLSRSFHLPDAMVLVLAQQLAPMQPPWKFVTPPVTMVSSMNSALLSKPPETESPSPEPIVMTPLGLHGLTSVGLSTKTCGYNISPTLYPSCKYLLPDTEMAIWLPRALQSKVKRWKQPFEPWGRPSPHWDSPTPAYKTPVNLISASTANCNITARPTHLHYESNQYCYKFSQ